MTVVLDDTSVINFLIDGVVDRLTKRLLTDQDDPAKARLVRAGKLQADPTTRKINILVHPGGEEWQDSMNTNTNGPGVAGPWGTIGAPYGSTYFWRRLKVELQLFFANEPNRDDSRTKANVVLGRAHHALLTMPLGGLARDTFGEKAIAIQVAKSYLFEGGGQGDFNWRGNLFVEFLTEYEPNELG